nr:hypothetical protein [Tanacetum cinerariifolium]
MILLFHKFSLIFSEVTPRKHPLLLLSGVGTNAIGYDLSPEASFARYMCEQGFDTWILEVRGAGLSMHESNPKEIEQSAHAISEQMEAGAQSAAENARLSSESVNSNESASMESRDLSQKLINVIAEGQRSVSPPLSNLHERLTSTMDDFQKQLELMVIYDWDFDHYLEEDVPSAVR